MDDSVWSKIRALHRKPASSFSPFHFNCKKPSSILAFVVLCMITIAVPLIAGAPPFPEERAGTASSDQINTAAVCEVDKTRETVWVFSRWSLLAGSNHKIIRKIQAPRGSEDPIGGLVEKARVLGANGVVLFMEEDGMEKPGRNTDRKNKIVYGTAIRFNMRS